MAKSPTSSYDLSPQQIKKLCDQFLKTVQQRPSDRFGCYIFGGNDKFSNLGRYVESKVFDESFQNNPKIMAEEYGPYDSASTIFVVVDHQAVMPVGALRVIKHSKADLKTLTDLVKTPLAISPKQFYEKYQIKPEKCVDLATVAVDKDYRGRTYDFIPSLLLYRTLYTQVLQNPKNQAVVSIIDKKLYELLLDLGMPFKPIFDSGPFSYLSSQMSYAVCARTNEFLPSVSQKAKRYSWSPNPTKQYMRRMMQQLIHGQGLDHMMGYPS